MEKDVFRALQSCPLYENISDEDIMRSMKDIPYELVQYPKKAIYKKTGQPIEFADIIVSGEVNGETRNSYKLWHRKNCGTVGYFFEKRHLPRDSGSV